MINRPISRQEGIGAVAIDEDLVATLGADAISYPSVTRDLREAKFAISNPKAIFLKLIRGHDDCDQAILLALDERPFASIYQLAPLTHLPRTTVHWRLTQSLVYKSVISDGSFIDCRTLKS
jgi:hypothetical protein